MLLLSCSGDVKLHNCNNFELINTYRPSNTCGYIKNVSWCKDGSWLVLVPNQGNAEIIRAKEDVRLLHSILGVAQPITGVFQRTTKKSLAISTQNGSVLLYDIKARNIKKRFTDSGATAPLLDWNNKDTHLAAGRSDGQITLYSNTTNQKSNTFRIPNSNSVSALRFHPTQRPMLGCASDEGVLVVWDINDGRRKFLMKSHQAPVTDLVFAAKNIQLLVSVALDRTFQCYDTSMDKTALSVLTDHPLSAVDLAPDGRTLAVGTTRGSIYIYDLREYKTPLKAIAAHVGEIRKLFYQPTAGDTRDSVSIPEEMSHKVEESTPTRSMTSDVFSEMGNSIPEFQPKIEATDLVDSSKKYRGSIGGDSFLDAFNNCDIRTANEISDPVQFNNLRPQTPQVIDLKQIKSENSPEFLQPEKCADIKSLLNVKPSSTPKENRVSFTKTQEISHANMSSVLGASAIPQVNMNELRQMVKEVLTDSIKDVVKDVVTDVVKTVVKENDCDIRRDLNKTFLKMQWVLSTISVDQNRILQDNNEPHNREPNNSDLLRQISQLQQENLFLKTKIDELFKKNVS